LALNPIESSEATSKTNDSRNQEYYNPKKNGKEIGEIYLFQVSLSETEATTRSYADEDFEVHRVDSVIPLSNKIINKYI